MKTVKYHMYAGSDELLGEWFPISKTTFNKLYKNYKKECEKSIDENVSCKIEEKEYEKYTETIYSFSHGMFFINLRKMETKTGYYWNK